MALQMEDKELEQHIIEAIQELSDLLDKWRKSTSGKDIKKAQLLSYWLKSYSRFLSRESSFNPQSIPKLTRRQIVSVDFGFRIGSELGGLHYAVVLDKQNGFKGDTVTVVPLGSKKEGFIANSNKILLQDGIYGPLKEKTSCQIENARKTILSLFETSDSPLPNDERLAEIRNLYKLAEEQISTAEASMKKMETLKRGSIANVSQRMTISERGRKEPVSPKASLYNVKVSERDMLQIEQAICEKYISGSKYSNKS